MKYPCNLVQDLLPLYFDGVCSEESRGIVEQHLLECPACKNYYEEMCNTEEVLVRPSHADREQQKAASLQAVKKKIQKRQILIAGLAVVLLLTVAFSVVGLLKHTSQIVEYNDNLSVFMVDNSLIGRLAGSRVEHAKIKNVDVTINGQEHTYLFFYVSDTKWDSIITKSDVFSECVLSPADKGADRIDAVYYYTGDYSHIESLHREELQTVIANSVLLWSK